MRNKRGKSSFFRKLKNNQRKYGLLLTNSENFNSTILEMKITRFQETLEMFRVEILAGKIPFEDDRSNLNRPIPETKAVPSY